MYVCVCVCRGDMRVFCPWWCQLLNFALEDSLRLFSQAWAATDQAFGESGVSVSAARENSRRL